MTSELLPNLRSLIVAALLILLTVGGLSTTSAGLNEWAWPAETTSNTVDIALGHRPQPPPPPPGPTI